MALKIVGLQDESLIRAETLSVERLHDGRQKAVQTKSLSFSFGEGSALVQGRIVEQVRTAQVEGTSSVSPGDAIHRHG